MTGRYVFKLSARPFNTGTLRGGRATVTAIERTNRVAASLLSSWHRYG